MVYLFPTDTIVILCNSLLLLSVDLSSPKVKNKMTKREFIKNLRGVVHPSSVDFIGDLYDDIYLRGHVAVPKGKCLKIPTFPFVRPYGNIFFAVWLMTYILLTHKFVNFSQEVYVFKQWYWQDQLFLVECSCNYFSDRHCYYLK